MSTPLQFMNAFRDERCRGGRATRLDSSQGGLGRKIDALGKSVGYLCIPLALLSSKR
jgi:hypothetical protein